MRIVAWNVERKRPTAPTGAAAVERIAREDAEIVVLTEAHLGHLDSLGGHDVASEASPGERHGASERKVFAWSRNPWREVDNIGDSRMPIGRFVAATTATSIGDVRVMAICIPWHMCDVRTGTNDRKPWEQHLRWLEYFAPLVVGRCALPVIIAGDFNQRIPRRKGGRKDAAAALTSTFNGYDIVTSGVPTGCERQGIDHIAIDARLRVTAVRGWPNSDGAVRMTDHDAVVADLAVI